jgi:hypothetical protein
MSVDDFLAAFFGPGNLVLPTLDFTTEAGQKLDPYLEPLRSGIRIPIVLPRRTGEFADAYIICWDRPQASSMRSTLEAFVAHSYVAFDGRPVRLNSADPVDNAVLQLVGPGTTYRLRPPERDNAARMWRGLDIMATTIRNRPQRVSPVPRPLGRILAEYRAALAAGNATGSADLLEELGTAGLSAVNLAYLRIYRLSRLGRDSELLRLPQLVDVIRSIPPDVIRDAILAAWGRLRLPDADLSSADLVAHAAAQMQDDDSGVALLARPPLDPLSREALTAVAVISTSRGDRELAASALTQLGYPTPSARPAALPDAHETAQDVDVVPDLDIGASGRPATWLQWVTQLTTTPYEDVEWATWSPPVDCDHDLAAAIEQLTDAEADAGWNMVGPFLDADEFGRPAWRTARALLLLAASYDRWAPADVSAIQALLEVFLRGSPPAADYGDVLDLFAATASRWAVANNALAALDMVDDVAHAPVSDDDARLRFAAATLEPLARHRRRLTPDLRWLATQLSADLSVPLDWDVPEPGEDGGEPSSQVQAKVLIYSLDDGVLQRTAERLSQLFPQVAVHQANDHVGTPQLRSHARNADVIALATRCAKHAATGFIRDHAANHAVIVEADGAGSASLLRAVSAGLLERS